MKRTRFLETLGVIFTAPIALLGYGARTKPDPEVELPSPPKDIDFGNLGEEAVARQILYDLDVYGSSFLMWPGRSVGKTTPHFNGLIRLDPKLVHIRTDPETGEHRAWLDLGKTRCRVNAQGSSGIATGNRQ